MGIDIALISTIVSAATAASSVIGGIQQRNAAEEQADLAMQEAEDRARIEARQNIRQEQRQKLAFLKSGVSLMGTPTAVLTETRSLGDEDINAAITTGETRAKAYSNSGRQALLKGFANAGSTAIGSFADTDGFAGLGSFGSGSSGGVPIPKRKPARGY